VRTAAAGNLLFTLKGPQQPAFAQNIEYTQYMPTSRHTLDIGQHIGPDRVADKMTVVALAMQDPAAAREFYLTKLGFTASKSNPMLLNLPGTSGQMVEIVPADPLGSSSSIVLTTPSLDKAAAQLTRQQVAFKRATSTTTDANGKTRSEEMITVTDPDGNILRIVAAH
jgi:catechol 2,3-dioxygenase-like lactoylglutathione lyase family enzyme